MSHESGRRMPPVARRVLELLLPEPLRDDIVHDLAEGHARRCASDGPFRARVWLWGQVARMRPWALRRALRQRARSAGGPPPPSSRSVNGSGVRNARPRGRWAARLEGAWSDVRHAFRSLRSQPGFSATVIATVALAVGATTSVFSVVNGVLLRPLPFHEPERLVLAWQTRPQWEGHSNPQLQYFASRFPLSVPTFFDWQEARTGLESMGIYTGTRWVYRSPEAAEIVRGLEVTSGVFQALAVEPLLGRTLIPDDDRAGSPPVLVLSYPYWRDRFGGDPEVVGRALSFDGTPRVVVGVMPEGFQVPSQGGDAWASLSDDDQRSDRTSQSFTVLGRLRDGATVETAQADLERVQEGLSATYPDAQADMRARVQGLQDYVVGDIRATLLLLLGTVGLVLTIACVNIANMLSVNGLARGRELAVKAALGASTGHLVRSRMAGSAVLAGIGGLCGIVLASLTLPVLLRVLPASVPRAGEIGIDAGVLAFGLLVTAATAVLVGVLPALQAAGAQPKQVMDRTARGLSGGRSSQRVRSGLVVTEMALAFVLLVGAGLLATSFHRLWTVDRGFRSEGLVAMVATPNPVDFPARDDEERFARDLRGRLEAIPGVTVTRTNQIPLSGSSSTTSYYVDREHGEQEEVNVMISLVDPDYFAVMEIGLVEGRGFDGAETPDGPRVAVANRALVDHLWPGSSGVGKELRADEDDPPTRIVGVAQNVRHSALHADAQPKLYVPVDQNHRSADQWILRVTGDPAAVVELARQAVTRVSASTPVRSILVLDEQIAAAVAVPRFRTLFVAGLALMATVLALLGVYGVVTFAVSQRVRELAVRLAIGAHPRDVVGGTLSSGLRLAAGGVAVGAVIAWGIASLEPVDAFLFQVDALSPLMYLAGALAVGLVGVAAAYLPARRAARVDVVTVLKAE